MVSRRPWITALRGVFCLYRAIAGALRGRCGGPCGRPAPACVPAVRCRDDVGRARRGGVAVPGRSAPPPACGFLGACRIGHRTCGRRERRVRAVPLREIPRFGEPPTRWERNARRPAEWRSCRWRGVAAGPCAVSRPAPRPRINPVIALHVFPVAFADSRECFPARPPAPGAGVSGPASAPPGGHSADVRRIVIRQDLKWSLFAVRGAVAGACRAPFRRDLGRVRPRRGGPPGAGAGAGRARGFGQGRRGPEPRPAGPAPESSPRRGVLCWCDDRAGPHPRSPDDGVRRRHRAACGRCGRRSGRAPGPRGRPGTAGRPYPRRRPARIRQRRARKGACPSRGVNRSGGMPRTGEAAGDRPLD